LADLEQSSQKQDAPKTHPRRTQKDAPESASDTKADSGGDAPKTRHEKTLEDALPQVVRYQERKEGATAPLSSAPQPDSDQDVRDVLQRLNDLAGTSYQVAVRGRPTKACALVRARLGEWGKAALLGVVERKVAEWMGDPRMEKFLTPATLFGLEKCEKYVGQLSCPVREKVQEGKDEGRSESAASRFARLNRSVDAGDATGDAGSDQGCGTGSTDRAAVRVAGDPLRGPVDKPVLRVV
jgi:uncharacterized phage protein (TIGR02220 family)